MNFGKDGFVKSSTHSGNKQSTVHTCGRDSASASSLPRRQRLTSQSTFTKDASLISSRDKWNWNRAASSSSHVTLSAVRHLSIYTNQWLNCPTRQSAQFENFQHNVLRYCMPAGRGGFLIHAETVLWRCRTSADVLKDCSRWPERQRWNCLWSSAAVLCMTRSPCSAERRPVQPELCRLYDVSLTSYVQQP